MFFCLDLEGLGGCITNQVADGAKPLDLRQ
jgi:hypothetical protein